ncbi:hypothetical protein ACJX0J_035559, partial [Zea mays]
LVDIYLSGIVFTMALQKIWGGGGGGHSGIFYTNLWHRILSDEILAAATPDIFIIVNNNSLWLVHISLQSLFLSWTFTSHFSYSKKRLLIWLNSRYLLFLSLFPLSHIIVPFIFQDVGDLVLCHNHRLMYLIFQYNLELFANVNGSIIIPEKRAFIATTQTATTCLFLFSTFTLLRRIDRMTIE